MSIQNKTDLQKAGYTCLAGYYTDSEVGMMGRVVEDAFNNNKDVAFSHSSDWRGTMVWQRSKRRAA
jgi:hypothetical protein